MSAVAPALLIAAFAGRALAQAARRAGYTPLVADMFGDEDCLAAAAKHRCAPGCLTSGRLEARAVVAAFADMARGRDIAGVVLGAGFEGQPETLDMMAARWPLLGCDAAALRRARSPEGLVAAGTALGIATPELACTPRPGFLAKRQGGCGGAHVRPAQAGDKYVYWQRHVPGTPVSALLIGQGGAPAAVIGFSEQWCAPAPGMPYRFGGAAQPAMPAPGMAEHLPHLIADIGLVGLCSVDMIADGDNWHVIEINPRPGATLDIFDSEATPLLARHVAACRGEAVASGHTAPPAALAILYADGPVVVPNLPPWCADRPARGTALAPGAPVCTICGKDRLETGHRLAQARAMLAPAPRSLAS